MNQKKRFVTPRVVQVAEVNLETDFLVGKSTEYDTLIYSAGQEYDDTELGDTQTYDIMYD